MSCRAAILRGNLDGSAHGSRGSGYARLRRRTRFCFNARHTGLCPGKVCDAQPLPKTIWHCASSYRWAGRTVNKATFEFLKIQLYAKCQPCQIPCVRNLKTHFGSMYHDKQEIRCSKHPTLRQLKTFYSQSVGTWVPRYLGT